MRFRTTLVVAASALLAGWTPARAQGGATFAGGVTRYHLQGASGTVPVGAARFEIPVGLYVILEPSITYFRWQPVSGAKVGYLAFEAGTQMQGYVSRFRPYIGGGIGYATPTRGVPGAIQNYLTLHAEAGTRFVLSRSWGLRAELRVRSVDPWNGDMVDLTFGFMQFTGRRS